MITILQGDCRQELRKVADASVQCCVTSPPYFGLRRYLPTGHPDAAREIGQEKTPQEYVAALVDVFREVKRCLRDDGTLWLNLGDSAVKKQLLGIPWRVAFALQADGWYLRSDIIWAKRNCIPESVTDRPTRSHEYLFLLSKQPRYYYDHEAIKEPCIWDVDGTGTAARKARQGDDAKSQPTAERAGIRRDNMERAEQCTGMRNKRDVWTVAPANFPEHETITWESASQHECGNGSRGIVSPNSPEHGGLFDLLSTAFCDEHEDAPLSRIVGICDRLSHEPKPGFVPIDQIHVYYFLGESLDSILQRRFQIATPHSSEMNKTALFVSTNLSCTPSAERSCRIAHTLKKLGWSEPHLDMLWNNTWLDVLDAHLWDRILYYTGDKFSCDKYYRERRTKSNHFATFPPALIQPCILAGSRPNDTVLDPFGGSGTTAQVALELGRHCTLVELNPSYLALIHSRTHITPGLPL